MIQNLAADLAPIETAALPNLGLWLIERYCAVLFQRSRWCKAYYAPVAVAAAAAPHPVFRVQNGAKVPWGSITP